MTTQNRWQNIRSTPAADGVSVTIGIFRIGIQPSFKLIEIPHADIPFAISPVRDSIAVGFPYGRVIPRFALSDPITDIVDLVQRFRTHIKQYKSSATKEAEIRQQFIDPFWRALGWDVGDTHGVGPSEADVIIEKNVETVDSGGIRSRRPDYLFRLSGFARFVVEAKKPAIDLDNDPAGIFQAKSYAWNSTIPFAILTDFEQFRLFDTTLKPIFNEPSRGLVAEFKIDFDQYESQWDTLIATFGRDAVEGGSLERLLGRLKKLKAGRRIRTVDRTLFDFKGSEPVDRVFLAYLDTHRRHLAAEVYRHNKASFPEADTLHGAAKLTAAVQRIMDRLVFMRVIEDRNVAPWGTLRDMLDRIGTEGGEFYESLCATFRDYDLKYNGYLFKPHFSEQLIVDGSVLADFTRTLYPPDGPWDFAAIGDDILGIVYERFLGNVVTVQHGQATIEEKPEVRHAGGVYYTPTFVVDSIIRRVIGPQIQGKTPLEVLTVKILDPACGSGSFLVAALQYLFDFCVQAIAKKPELATASVPATVAAGKKIRKKKAEIAFRDKDGHWYLSPDFRAALLTHCIHGVDIDQQAVEVTVMSLYLKMLASKLPANWQSEWVETRLLPALDNNILCGNSLIDDEGYDRFLVSKGSKQRNLFSVETVDTAFRINRFDWTSRTKGFGRILDEQAVKERGRAGFDGIIGNPPYIRVQELNKWAPEECEYYKWRYVSAAKGNYDIYVVFTEKALALLSPEGLLGFIMPHKWWQAKYGEGLRNLICRGKHLRSLVDFHQEQIFKGATTYTAIHLLSAKPNSGYVKYVSILKLYDGITQMTAIDSHGIIDGVEYADCSHPQNSKWSFHPETSRVSFLVANAKTLPLAQVARLAQGIKTSADKVFVLDIISQEMGIAKVKSAQTGKQHAIESKLIRPLIKSGHMKRFSIYPTEKALLFPYHCVLQKFVRLPIKALQIEYPLAWAYLNEVKDILEAREAGRMKGRDDWYSYIYPKNFDVMSKPKLVIPDMCEHMQIGIGFGGDYIFSGGAAGGNAIVPHDIALMPLMCGILNSHLIETFVRQTGTKFRGGYLNCEIRFICDIPIKLPETVAEKKLAGRIADSVRAIMTAKTALRDPMLSDHEKSQLERTVETHEKRIDIDVFALYGVDGLPGDDA